MRRLFEIEAERLTSVNAELRRLGLAEHPMPLWLLEAAAPRPGESFWHRFRFVRQRWTKKHGGVWYRAIAYYRRYPGLLGSPFPWRWASSLDYALETRVAFAKEHESGTSSTYCTVEIDSEDRLTGLPYNS